MEKSRAIELLEHLAWDRDIERNPYGDALNIAIDALKAQLSHEDATSDTISKTETVEHLRRVLEATVPITDYDGGFIDGIEFSISTVSTMPPAQPERKKGKWIDYTEDGYVECPFCHSATNCDGNKDELHFCFSCGADMRGEKDG